jgi:branched-chain amino acid transport system permease protein
MSELATQSLPLESASESRARTWPKVAWTALVVALAFAVVPWFASDYLLSAILIPVLVLALAGLGQNIVTGYAGLLSVGSAAFMAVGAFAAYNLSLRVPGVSLLVSFVFAGACAALVGVAFGLPSLRIRGFYLIASTLAAQFFVQWLFTKVGWFSNYNSSGVISAPPLVVAGFDLSDPKGRYVLTLAVVLSLTWLARNLLKAGVGHDFMAVRDMEVAASVIGIPVVRTKLLAFGVSSFYLGVAGALWAFTYLGTVEPHGFDLTRSFQILSIVIIGGLGSLEGAFIGALFFVLLPIGLSVAGEAVLGGYIDAGVVENLQKVVFGGLIVAFLIKEPEGFARLLRRSISRGVSSLRSEA